MSEFRISKGHGLGNDYLVADVATLPAPLSPARIRFLCDRHRGLGSDGILLADPGDPIRLRIFNPDGTEAEKSGNGLRIFGAWLYRHGRVTLDEWFEVALIRDTVRMRVESELANGALQIRVELGRATFRGAAVGFRPRAEETLDYELALPAGGSARINTVSLANPHCVVFVDTLRRDDFLARAPQLCTHPEFGAGTNVQFARVAGPRTLEAWIWERGVGETLASGSSASAVCAAAVRRGLVAAGQLEVVMPGGGAQLEVTPACDVILIAPAQLIYTAALEAGAVAEYLALA
ncbi:MAG: diaminopimelate epimerase [Gemmatimonadetes bacterium]|nr:diaminopimelate epimerase [Gemmatimonadota bacterium]